MSREREGDGFYGSRGENDATLCLWVIKLSKAKASSLFPPSSLASPPTLPPSLPHLQKIPSIRPKQGLVQGHHRRARTPGKPTHVLTPTILEGDILRLVCVYERGRGGGGREGGREGGMG